MSGVSYILRLRQLHGGTFYFCKSIRWLLWIIIISKIWTEYSRKLVCWYSWQKIGMRTERAKVTHTPNRRCGVLLTDKFVSIFLWDCSELNVWVVIKAVRCHGNLSEYEGRIMNIYDSSGSVVIDENFHNHIKLVSCSNPFLARLRHI